MIGLLTAEARRHIRTLLKAVAPHAGRLDRQLSARLRVECRDGQAVRVMLAITPAAAARAGSLSRFLEQVEASGRLLAKLNVTPEDLAAVLEKFERVLDGVLDGHFAPAREQLALITQIVLRQSFYEVREAETQAFFALCGAEAGAGGREDLLQRFSSALAWAFQAAAGRLVIFPGPAPGKLARPLYLERGGGERWIADPKWHHRYASYWSYPFGSQVVLQLGFRTPNPWLPRDRNFLAAAAARFRAALERMRMEGEVRRLEAEARRAEEEERRRIGRELHDQAGQDLMLLRLELEMIGRDAPESLRGRLAEARELAGRTGAELRRIVAALSPAQLERLGLGAALRQLVTRYRKLHGAAIRLRFSGDAGDLPRETQEVIYRVAQECFQNIAKHAQAQRVNLYLHRADKSIRLSVADNGAGFCAETAFGKPRSFGLAGMRERAALLGGTLAIRSAPGEGTRVTLKLPVSRAAPAGKNGKDSLTTHG